MQRDDFLARVKNEITETDAWTSIVKPALRQQCQAIAMRTATRSYADLRELQVDQARHAVLLELLTKPADLLCPKEER